MPKKRPNYYSSCKNAPFDGTEPLARGNFKQLKTEGDIFYLLSGWPVPGHFSV
jgi:hypothetical protein